MHSPDQIQSLMENADIILMMISPFFMNSDFIYGTPLETALNRHQNGKCLLIPELAIPIDYESTPFGGLQVLPRTKKPMGKPDNYDALFQIQTELKRLIEKE